MPGLTAGWVRQAFDGAVDGVGPLRGAAEAADRRGATPRGTSIKAIQSLIDSHVRMAGAQGFLTNIGGIVTMAVTMPANISGLALLQCHLVGGIAHLRGYDLDDPRVRNAVLACMLGEERGQATGEEEAAAQHADGDRDGAAHDPTLDRRIAAEVTAELLIPGRRQAHDRRCRVARYTCWSAAPSARSPTAATPTRSASTPRSELKRPHPTSAS